jgi:hypothetical protein
MTYCSFRSSLVKGWDLVAWADQQHLGLAGLEVGPPSLEEAYLSITGESAHTRRPST